MGRNQRAAFPTKCATALTARTPHAPCAIRAAPIRDTPVRQPKPNPIRATPVRQPAASLDKALAAWGGRKITGDDPAAGEIGLLDTWQINNAVPGQSGRAADQVEFMAHTQYDHYADVRAHLRKLGCKQLTNAGNWITADAIRLNDVERWTYTAMDVIAINKYYGGEHKGPNCGWRIDPGDTYTSISVVHDPAGIPACLKQVKGLPMMITESSWVNPNLWQSEGPLVMSALQSLTGIDCDFWFAQTATTYDDSTSISLPWFHVNGQNPAFKWSCSIPAIMGSFPAAAVAFRQEHIRPAQPVVSEVRSLDSMWKRERPIIAEDANTIDPNRQEGGEAQRAMARLRLDKGVDPLAFFVGPVVVEYGGKGETQVGPLEKYIDRPAKTVTSVTGELKLDWGRGVFTVNTPKTKGVTGFLLDAGGSFILGGSTITSSNRYATVMVTALDNQPLEKSRNVLIQVGTLARPTGWEATDLGGGKFRVARNGVKPWQVVKTAVTVALPNPGLTKATLLDVAGFTTGTAIKLEKTNTGVRLNLPDNAMYVVLTNN